MIMVKTTKGLGPISSHTAAAIVVSRRRRGRAAKHRDLMTNDMDGMLTGADAAELLSGLGGCVVDYRRHRLLERPPAGLPRLADLKPALRLRRVTDPRTPALPL
jgi:hypothetical protein